MQLGNIYNRDERLAKGEEAKMHDRMEGDSGVDNGLIRDVITKATGLKREDITHSVIWRANEFRNAHKKGDTTMEKVYRDNFRVELIYNDVNFPDKESFLAMFRPLASTLLALTPESDPHGSKIENPIIKSFLYPYLPEKTLPEDYLVSNLHAYRTATNKGNPEEIKKAKIAVWQGLKNHGKEMSQVDFERFLHEVIGLKSSAKKEK